MPFPYLYCMTCFMRPETELFGPIQPSTRPKGNWLASHSLNTKQCWLTTPLLQALHTVTFHLCMENLDEECVLIYPYTNILITV